MLVDDAIVEIENIVRHMRMGKSGFQAALDAADEIGLAVVATSFTIIAVFLPVSFMGGVTGQFFRQFGLTVAAAVFFSLLVARLITPVLAAYTLHGDAVTAHAGRSAHVALPALLRWCVANRWKTVAAGVAFFALSVGLLAVIPKAFVPPEDFANAELDIELPPGVQLEDTARVSAAVTALLRRSPRGAQCDRIRRRRRGGGCPHADPVRAIGAAFAARHEPEGLGTGDDRRTRPDTGRAPEFLQPGGGGRDVQLYLTGNDPDELTAVSRRVLAELRGLPELRDPRIKGDLPRPEIVVHPRLDIAAELGVSVQNISQTIRIATLGDLPQNGAKFSLADRLIPIRVSLAESARRDLATLENLPVPTSTGTSVPLKSVAEVSFGQGPSAIRRYNQRRRAFIESDLSPGVTLGTATARIYALPSLTHLPRGVQLVQTGDTEYMKELFDNFLLAIGAALLMVLAVLVLLFARLFQPITILSALPLSLGGAVLALLLANEPFSLAVVIGILMLMGIVAKNSILLVDFAIVEMRAGRNQLDAILEAGHKRARPIVMTTVAMVAGMLPVAFGWGGDGDFRSPMAIAVIGGLITSTLLTLVIVPAVFTLFDDVERWMSPRAARILAHSGDPAIP